MKCQQSPVNVIVIPLINMLKTVNHCSPASWENHSIPWYTFWVVAGPGKLPPTEWGNGKRGSNVMFGPNYWSRYQHKIASSLCEVNKHCSDSTELHVAHLSPKILFSSGNPSSDIMINLCTFPISLSSYIRVPCSNIQSKLYSRSLTLCFDNGGIYTERQKKLIPSSERHSLKS